jgi:hypothetical protein
MKQVASRANLLHACSLVGLFFDREDGYYTFLQNVCWISTAYTALYQFNFNVCFLFFCYRPSRCSDWLRVERPRDRSSGWGSIFLPSTSSRPVLGSTQPPIQWVKGTISPEVKRLRHEADHSRPTDAEIKNMWIYTSTFQYIFMAYGLISYARGQINFSTYSKFRIHMYNVAYLLKVGTMEAENQPLLGNCPYTHSRGTRHVRCDVTQQQKWSCKRRSLWARASLVAMQLCYKRISPAVK